MARCMSTHTVMSLLCMGRFVSSQGGAVNGALLNKHRLRLWKALRRSSRGQCTDSGMELGVGELSQLEHRSGDQAREREVIFAFSERKKREKLFNVLNGIYTKNFSLPK